MPSESYEQQSRAVRARRTGNLSIAQARVLRTLNCGGMLAKNQIEAAVGLTARKTRQAIAELIRRDLIFTSSRTGRYEITTAGRNALAVQPSGFGQLS